MKTLIVEDEFTSRLLLAKAFLASSANATCRQRQEAVDAVRLAADAERPTT